MRRSTRHANIFAGALLLASGGAALGVVASGVTSSAIQWRPPASAASAFTPTEPTPPPDQFAAGRSWAQTAFDGGLRRCPHMNADFVAACEAEMKALKARPAFASGSYGGPLLVTAYTPPEPIEPEPAASSNEIESTAEAQPIEPPLLPVSFTPTPDDYPATGVEP